MRRTQLIPSFVFLASATALVVMACGGNDQPPPNAANQPPPQGTYQQPPPQGTWQQPPPQNTFQQPPPSGVPTGPAPTGAPQGQMATPGPLALPCQNDGACGLHRCNMQFQKCAFPCQTPVDCAQGNNCTVGVCVPKPPGSP